MPAWFVRVAVWCWAFVACGEVVGAAFGVDGFRCIQLAKLDCVSSGHFPCQTGFLVVQVQHGCGLIVSTLLHCQKLSTGKGRGVGRLKYK